MRARAIMDYGRLQTYAKQPVISDNYRERSMVTDRG